MGADSAAERQREELRAEIDTLRALIQLALDGDADRDLVIATAKMLREREDRLAEFQGFPGSD